MARSIFMAVVAVACILLGMVLMVGFSSCSHSSDDFIGDNPDTRYFGISGDGAGNGSSGTGGTSTGS